MRLEITNQTNEQECGVCALTSLHNYFYKEQLQKEQVLDKSKITPTGMTIFDFEILAKQTGIECESYEIQWSEFIKLHINNYFVAIVSANNGQTNHYVICKKTRKEIIIYDSCSTEVKHLKYDQFKNLFLNVIILISKKPNKTFNKVFGNSKTLLLFDLKFVLVYLLLSLLLLGTSIVAASFLNWIIDASISKGSVNNLITISFVFVLVYFSNDLLTYISNLYVSDQMKSYCLLFTNKILSSIEFKASDFLNKVDKNWIYKVDECVYNISNFCIFEVNKFITNIIFSIICVCIIGSLQPWLLIFVVLFIVAELIPFLFSYRKKKELFTTIVRVENKNAQHYKRLIQSLSFETWHNKRKTLIGTIKNNYSSIYKNFNDATIFRSNNNLAKSLAKSFLEIVMIAFASYLIIKNKSLSIGQLTFVIATFALFKNSISDISSYFLAKIEFNVYWQVYKDLTDVSNLNEAKLDLSQDIKSIEFVLHNEVISIDSSKKINIINTSIKTLLSDSDLIKLNGEAINKNSKQLFENTILIDEHSAVDIDLFLSLMNDNPELYAKYLRYFKIDINANSMSFENKLIMNLLCALHEQKKIIFIDSILDYFKQKDKSVLKELINKIRANNNLFIIGKVNYD